MCGFDDWTKPATFPAYPCCNGSERRPLPGGWAQHCPGAAFGHATAMSVIGTTLQSVCSSPAQAFATPLGCCQSCAGQPQCSAWMHLTAGACGPTCVLFTGTVMMQPLPPDASHVTVGLRQPRPVQLPNGTGVSCGCAYGSLWWCFCSRVPERPTNTCYVLTQCIARL